MLSPFQIRNLRPNQPKATQDAPVRISAPGYDKTISSHPAAKLRYHDEEDDLVTVGSSTELVQRLAEPTPQQPRTCLRSLRNPMAIATVLSESQQSPPSLTHHVFDIEDREEIRKLWQEIQEKNNSIPRPSPIYPTFGEEWKQASKRIDSRQTPRPRCDLYSTKQSSDWTQSEEKLLIMLRDRQLKWTEIQDQMSNRSATECKIHYENCLDEKCTWDEGKKNDFARAYKELRSSIWTPLASKIGVSWREAEIMHWNLGQDDFPKRGRTPFPEINLEDHQPSETSKTGLKSQPPSEAQTKQVEAENIADKAPSFDDLRSSAADAASSLDASSPSIGLTPAAKRQAQAAGDMLRARTTPSRLRKGLMAATDHTNHQNRWANYQSSSSAFLPKGSTCVAQGSAPLTLTSEGKRQTRVAGDKLRSRATPIRHSRLTRGSISDHAVDKNRWSIYAPRATNFDERHDAQIEPGDKAPSENVEPEEADGKCALLEVFEAELAKKISKDITHEDAKASLPTLPTSTPESGPHLHSSSSTAVSAPRDSTPQVANPLLNSFRLIQDHFQELTIGNNCEPQAFPRAMEQGFRAALDGFSTFLNCVTTGLHEASNLTRQAANRTRETGMQPIKEAMSSLSNVLEDAEALCNNLRAPNPEINDMREAGVNDTASIVKEASNADVVKNCNMPLKGHGPFSASNGSSSPLRNTSKSGLPRPISVRRSSTGPKALNIRQVRARKFVSDVPVTVTRNWQPDSLRSSPYVIDRVPGYYKPRPIHPRHHPVSAQSPLPGSQALAKGSGATSWCSVDHLRRHQSKGTVDEQEISQSATLPAAAARFPTLAQFEGQNFASNTQFPQLPSMSMEPLVPLRANSQSETDSPSTQPQMTEEQAKGVRMTSTNSGLENSSITAGKLNESQLRSFEQQRAAMQSDSMQVYAQHLAESRTPQSKFDADKDIPKDFLSATVSGRELGSVGVHGFMYNPAVVRGALPLQDYQTQLMLLEQQKKDRLVMPRKEQAECLKVLPPEIPNNGRTPKKALLDYQRQLMLTEQNKRGDHLVQQQDCFFPPRREEPEARSQSEPSTEMSDLHGVEGYKMQLKGMIPAVRQEVVSIQEGEPRSVSDVGKVPGAFPSAENSIGVKNPENAEGPSATDLASIFYDSRRPGAQPSAQEAMLSGCFSSAARLAEPFDPLEVEPSAQPHFIEAVCRNATVAGTDSRHNGRRRRPYSEAFDGKGRIGWDAFLGDDSHYGLGRSPIDRCKDRPAWASHQENKLKCNALRNDDSRITGQDHLWLHEKDNWNSTPLVRARTSTPSFEKPDHERGLSPCLFVDGSQTSKLSFKEFEDERELSIPRDYDTARRSHSQRRDRHDRRDRRPISLYDNRRKDHKIRGTSQERYYDAEDRNNTSPPHRSASIEDWDERRKIYDCVAKLRDLGFAKYDDESGVESRLWMYASATKGDLVEAIDMIDEERRAYKERKADGDMW